MMDYKITKTKVRFYISKGKKYWVFLAVLLFLILAFYPVVFQGKTLMGSPFAVGVMGNEPPYKSENKTMQLNKHQLDPGAAAWCDEPWAQKASVMFKNLTLPLWNSNQALGKPFAANMQSAVFYPLRVLLYIYPSSGMWDFYMLLRVAIAIFLTYKFLRIIGLERVSSLLGGFVYGLGGYFVFFISMAHINVDIILPLLLISLESIARAKKNAWLLLGLSIFLMITGGHPETALLAGTFGIIYFIIRLISNKENILKKIRMAIYGLLLGLGASMFLILPFFELYQYAYTTHAPSNNLSLGHFDIRTLANMFFPYFFGWPHVPTVNTWGSWSGTEGYVGVGALFLSVMGILSIVMKQYRQYVIAFLAILFIIITKLYGLLPYDFLVHVPFYNAIGYQKYLTIGFEMCFAVLAAIGLDYLLKIEKRRILLIIIPAIILLAAMFYLHRFFPLMTKPIPRRVIIQYFIPLIFIVSALIISQVSKYKKIYRIAVIIFALLVVLELVALVPRDWPDRDNPYNKPPYVSFLQQHFPERVFGLNYLLYPNTASAYNIEDIRDLDAVYINYYFRYIKEFVNTSVFDRFTGTQQSQENEGLSARIVNNPLFDLLNVKYVITNKTPISHDFIDQIVESNRSVANLYLSSFKINGEMKNVLYQTPDSKAVINVTPKSIDSKLTFYSALSSEVWKLSSDGVVFKIFVNNEEIFSEKLDPKNNTADQKWSYHEVSLGKYKDQEIELSFVVDKGNDSTYDWSGWGALSLNDIPENDSQYRLVYNKEVDIYENTHVYPRAFLVSNVINSKSEEETVKIMKGTDFDSSNTAVIESTKNINLHLKKDRDFNSVKINTYKDQYVELVADASSRSFMILSDTYYPGWNAYIDGKKTVIYKTDLALRGVEVPKGNHKIEFKYEPSSYKIGSFISLISFLSVLMYLLRLRYPKRVFLVGRSKKDIV